MPPTLHNRLRELRQARSWTQEELAALTGVSRQSINSIPSLPLALTLAQVFRCPVEQLFTLDPPNNHKEPQP